MFVLEQKPTKLQIGLELEFMLDPNAVCSDLILRSGSV